MNIHTHPRRIPLDVFCEPDSLAPSSVPCRVLAALYALCSSMSMYIRRRKNRLFYAVDAARGSIHSPISIDCLHAQNAKTAPNIIPMPLPTLSTASPQLSPREARNRLKAMPAYPAAGDELNDNPFPAELANKLPVHGTYGRWCLNCQDWQQYAVLIRYGKSASEVDYVPSCPICGAILFPISFE